MRSASPSILSLSFIALAALGGCATDVDDETDGRDEPVVAKPQDDTTSLAPEQLNTGGGTGCTTSTTCDANYCCTTEECRFTTTITCRPNYPKTTVTNLSAFTPQ